MTREQAQIVRLLLMCAAWAIGQTLTLNMGASYLDLVIPAALAIGVYVLTDDLGRGGFGGGNVKYWRGRRIDDDARGRRLDDDERRGGRWN